ncbi:MAG TPA: type II toxin-antitoxin system RelE/ParE family toxin [Castellaniella sp.]|uniref:type II toxin-antitoxin system RelE/ParE family toxin n=1 Tax=Castellaniella sp. TaxID=1955812 RepID=UPI002EDDDFC9
MYIVKQTPAFEAWLSNLKDSLTRIRLGKRLDKVQRGILGDVGPVGEGVSEMREHFGPGLRIKYHDQDHKNFRTARLRPGRASEDG